MAAKFFRVATEGVTSDKRTIPRAWLAQMAANYDPKKFGARVWLEHLRGLYPDSAFRAYGDVLALKTEEVDGKLALFAQIDPTPDLVAMVKARQKIYTSMEVDPDFAGSGEAYFVGLAVTDTPASLGTEMLRFAAQAQANPLADRKQRPENLFTAATETTIDLEDPTMTTKEQKSDDASLLAQIKAAFSAKPAESKDEGKPEADTGAALLELAGQIKAARDEFSASGKAAADQVADLSKKLEVSDKAFSELKSAHEKLQADFNALQQKLDTTPAGGNRPPATGGNADADNGF